MDFEVLSNRARTWPKYFRTQSILLFYAVLALLLLTAIFVYWNMLRPLAQLRRAALALARGRPSHRLQSWPDDEFGSLADALNRLAQRKRRSRTGA